MSSAGAQYRKNMTLSNGNITRMCVVDNLRPLFEVAAALDGTHRACRADMPRARWNAKERPMRAARESRESGYQVDVVHLKFIFASGDANAVWPTPPTTSTVAKGPTWHTD